MTAIGAQVVIASVGAHTSVGDHAAMTAASIRAGITRMSMHPYIIDRGGEPLRVASAQHIQLPLSSIERFAALAVPALHEVLKPLASRPSRRGLLGLYLGLPEPRPGFDEADIRGIKEALGDILDAKFQPLPYGHCGGTMAIQRAHENIMTGRFEFCIAGGVDSYMHDKTLTWLDRSGQLQSSGRRSGMVPGEAAAFCLLCRPSAARSLGLLPSLTIITANTSIESHSIKRKTICVGEGLAAAIQATTGGAPVDSIYCDINGERYRNEEWGMASLRLPDVILDASRYEAPASVLGDVGAASGPLFVVLAQEALRRRYAHGRRFLGWTSAEGGHRSAFVLESLVPKNNSAEVLP